MECKYQSNGFYIASIKVNNLTIIWNVNVGSIYRSKNEISVNNLTIIWNVN